MNKLIRFFLLCLVLSGASPCFAQGRLFTPGPGLGGGRLSFQDFSAPVLQIDFGFGFEAMSGNATTGVHLRLDFMAGSTGYDLDVIQLDFVPMLTFGHGFSTAEAYWRLGVGPVVSWNGYSPYAGPDYGGQAEIAIGIKDIMEAYLDLRKVYDPRYPFFATTAGLRFTSPIWVQFVVELLNAILD